LAVKLTGPVITRHLGRKFSQPMFNQQGTQVHKRTPATGIGIDLQVPVSSLQRVADTVVAAVNDPFPRATKLPGAPFRLASYGYAFVWAPYIAPGSFEWVPFLLSLFLEFLLSFVLGWVVTTVASYVTATSIGLNAMPVALVYAVGLVFGQSWRAAEHLPRHLFPGLTWAENMHTHIGLVVSIPYFAVQLAGSALDAPVLTALGSTDLPNYATAARPISFWGAVALQTALQALAIYAYQQNASFKHHHLLVGPNGPNASAAKERRGTQRAFKATSLFFGLAVFLCVMITYPNGLYSLGNYVIEFGPLINTGAWNTPDSGYWTLPMLWFLVAGTISWAVHLLTWNINALTDQAIASMASKEFEGEAEETAAEETGV
jgi:hypothetical protein